MATDDPAALSRRLAELEQEKARLEATVQDMQMAIKGYGRLKQKLREENRELTAALRGQGGRRIIGADGGLAEALRVADKVVATPLPVLITGESGTGKEVFARYIHERGPRASGPYVAVNCAAFPEGLLESELFGIEKGAATGVGEHAGKFERASGGTLFLDEVGDMTLPMQAKILRALQEGEIERVGSKRTIKVDVRILSATNKDLAREVAERRFREDLFYRLVGVHIHLPPLRERRGDLDRLLEAFVADAAGRLGRRVRGFTPAALDALRAYPWPGNVRELMAEVQRGVAMAEGELVDVGDLTPRVTVRAAAPAPVAAPATKAAPGVELLPLADARTQFERSYIESALAASAGSRNRAARVLGMSREGFRKKLIALGFPPGDEA